MKNMLRFAAAAACLAASPAFADQLVTNGDFSAGMAGFTTTYGPLGSPSSQGSIAITTNPGALCSCFPSIGDHTSGSGNMLLIDGADTNTGAFWSQTFAVEANSNYAFSLWATSLGTGGPAPILRATINGVSVFSQTLPYTSGNTATTWQQHTANFASGAATSVTLSLFDDAMVYSYNDLAVDDISFVGPAAVAAVPEPATWGVMVLGFGATGFALRRRVRPAVRPAFA